MYLKNIKLWNFRKYGSSDFNLNTPNLDLNFTKGLNVLIGDNDSGKTAIIDAIKLVLKTHSYEWIKIKDTDFFKEQKRFRIELLFDDLSEEEASSFTEWIGVSGEGAAAKPFLKIMYDVKRNGDRIFPADIRAGADNEGDPINAEAAEYLKITYLKPLRDAESELIAKKNSRLSQILQSHEAFQDKKEHELMNVFKSFNKSIEAYFKGKDNQDIEIEDKSGKELKDKIDEYIQAFYDKDRTTEFKASDANLRSILEKLELSIKEVINPGLGTLNRLFMASELLHLKKENWSGLRLGLIEEIEAHLHPQAQMKVIESLQKYTDIQIILTTHSPNLASKVQLKNMIICDGENAFPLGKEYTELSKDNYMHLERFLDVTKSNLFFAKGVIFVEGWAEEILIPALARKIGINLTEKEVSIVNIGHIGFEHYSKIFLRKDGKIMNVPVAIVTDVDERTYEKNPKKDAEGKVICVEGKVQCEYIKRDEKLVAKLCNEKTKGKETEYNKGQNKVFISQDWTLEYSLYKSAVLSNKVEEIIRKIHSGSDWDEFEKELAKKLINKSLGKTEIAYKLAMALDNNEIIGEFVKEDSIYYLVEAIKYASRES